MADKIGIEQDIEKNIEETKQRRSEVLYNQSFKNNYEVDDKFTKQSGANAHTTIEMVEALQSGDNFDIDAVVLGATPHGLKRRRMGKKDFLEHFANGSGKRQYNKIIKKCREAIAFNQDPSAGGDFVGSQDFVPVLGGPFYKQLYYYDYLKMHNSAFYAYNHDPIAHISIQIMRDFILGRGWRVDCDDPKALEMWKAFEEVNNLYEMVGYIALELAMYGEELIWWLPNHETKISYQVGYKDQTPPPKGIIPRIRLIDPSVIWDIVTYPEDITRVLFYQWIAPTQYQTYTYDNKTNQSVPTSKFIFQQIPADEVDHWKINCVDNEKRGRSDLFPVLGYLKRLRDTVQYEIIARQKQSAWAIDTTIKGSAEDINSYVRDQQALGPIPPAGSEYVHSDAIVREYLSHAGGRGSSNSSFEECFSMIAAGLGIPISYYGTHLSGGSTRASALVSTEPVAKRFEYRQEVLKLILKKLAKRLFATMGIKGAEIEVTFPEIVTQDRSQKLKDLALANAEGWVSKKRAATIAAKELGIIDFDYNLEKEEIDKEGGSDIDYNPLTKTGLTVDKGQGVSKSSSALTSDEKKNIKDDINTL